MDKWKDLELEKMKVGGNQRAREFFEAQSDYDDSMSIQQKYNTRAAALYRDKISTLAQGKDWDMNKSSAKNYQSSSFGGSSNSGHMSHSKSTGSIQNHSSSYQDGGNYTGGYQNFNTQEFKSQKEDFFSRKQMENASRPDTLPPNQGGKYSGFGYTREAPPRSQSQEVFDSTFSSLASGFGFLSMGAAKVVGVAKENAFKYGTVAAQKVVEVSSTVSDKVCFEFYFGFVFISHFSFNLFFKRLKKGRCLLRLDHKLPISLARFELFLFFNLRFSSKTFF